MGFRKQWLAAVMVLTLIATGCGFGGSGDGPDAVIGQFLEAIRKGDDKTATDLLTATARQKTGEMEMVVAPPGSDTATYKVLEVEIEGNEAQVGTQWTDLDADGRPHSDTIVWMVRKEETGWRIHGMATRVFPDLPAVILNFEDPADMLRKQQQTEQEMARREAQPPAAPQNAAEPTDSKVR